MRWKGKACSNILLDGATGLFLKADSDGSGSLDRKEFTLVLKSAELKLGDRCVEYRTETCWSLLRFHYVPNML